MKKVLKIHIYKEELQKSLDICNEELSIYKSKPVDWTQKIHYDFYSKLKKEVENKLWLIKKEQSIFNNF